MLPATQWHINPWRNKQEISRRRLQFSTHAQSESDDFLSGELWARKNPRFGLD